jgi:hypothetical protein
MFQQQPPKRNIIIIICVNNDNYIDFVAFRQTGQRLFESIATVLRRLPVRG